MEKHRFFAVSLVFVLGIVGIYSEDLGATESNRPLGRIFKNGEFDKVSISVPTDVADDEFVKISNQRTAEESWKPLLEKSDPALDTKTILNDLKQINVNITRLHQEVGEIQKETRKEGNLLNQTLELVRSRGDNP